MKETKAILLSNEGHYTDLDNLKWFNRWLFILTGRFFLRSIDKVEISKYQGFEKGDVITIKNY